MSELRFNELRGEQVVYAIHRQERTFLPSREHCPLCPTGPRRPGDRDPLPGLRDRRLRQPLSRLRGAARRGRGGRLHRQPRRLVRHARARARRGADVGLASPLQELGAREDVEYVLIFENRGVEVGVTLHHPHGQIYGYPFLPPVPEARARRRRAPGGLRAVRAAATRARGRPADRLRERRRRRLHPLRRALGL